MEEKELQEFSLEDIINEFRDPNSANNSPSEEELPKDPSAEIEAILKVAAPNAPEDAPAAQPVIDPEPTVLTQDTISLDMPELKHTPVTEQTIRLDAIPDTVGKVRNAAPLTEETESPQPPPGALFQILGAGV